MTDLEFNIDVILQDWAEKVHDGSPNPQNPSHVLLLKDVLYELKYPDDIVDQFISNLQGTDSVIEEANKAPKKKSPLIKARNSDIETIINHLTSNIVFDQAIIDQMLKLVSRDQEAYYKLIETIKGYNIKDKYAKEIADAAFSFADPSKFIKYLNSRSLNVSKLHGKSIDSALKSAGINGDFLKWLINYQWVGTPAVGSGEVALAILLKGGGMATGAGDIAVSGKPVEIKGSGGRLKGQHGFESGLAAGQVFEKELQKLAKKLPKEESVNIPKAGGNQYNLSKTGWAVSTVGGELIAKSKGKVKAKDIQNVWMTGFETMYVGIKGSAKGFLQKAVKQVGPDGDVKDIGRTGAFMKNLLSACMQHYMDQEGFDTIVVLERGGKMAVVQAKDVSNLLSKISISAPPSFTTKAGSQGATFQIKV